MLWRSVQVVEDVTEGSVVTGLSTRVAKSAEELRGMYNSGRASTDTQVGRILAATHSLSSLQGSIMDKRITFTGVPAACCVGEAHGQWQRPPWLSATA